MMIPAAVVVPDRPGKTAFSYVVYNMYFLFYFRSLRKLKY